jgi:GNAT superfamily N-acetyltransferase
MIEFDGYRPGCLADIVALHARYYARNWGFGLAFETKVASELAAFLAGMDPQRDLFLAAYEDGAVAGSIAVDVSGGGPRGAHLRWFIVSAQGCGLGKTLLERAMRFCDEQSKLTVWLTTFAGLDAARALYERHGFRLVEESDVDQWQGGVREQLFERCRPVQELAG